MTTATFTTDREQMLFIEPFTLQDAPQRARPPRRTETRAVAATARNEATTCAERCIRPSNQDMTLAELAEHGFAYVETDPVNGAVMVESGRGEFVRVLQNGLVLCWLRDAVDVEDYLGMTGRM